MLFRIYNSDGDTRVEFVTKEQVIAEMKEATEDGCEPQEYFDALPSEPDTNYWPEGHALLIEGRIVRPKPKTVATSWEL